MHGPSPAKDDVDSIHCCLVAAAVKDEGNLDGD